LAVVAVVEGVGVRQVIRPCLRVGAQLQNEPITNNVSLRIFSLADFLTSSLIDVPVVKLIAVRRCAFLC
jgi:hypothetical protein